jgi:hypothetical protein
MDKIYHNCLHECETFIKSSVISCKKCNFKWNCDICYEKVKDHNINKNLPFTSKVYNSDICEVCHNNIYYCSKKQ